MTVYNFRNRALSDDPVRVFDAHGEEHENVFECDTETGRIVKAKLNEYGGVLYDQHHPEEVAKEEIDAPAPLRVERIESISEY